MIKSRGLSNRMNPSIRAIATMKKNIYSMVPFPFDARISVAKKYLGNGPESDKTDQPRFEAHKEIPLGENQNGPVWENGGCEPHARADKPIRRCITRELFGRSRLRAGVLILSAGLARIKPVYLLISYILAASGDGSCLEPLPSPAKRHTPAYHGVGPDP